MHPELMLYIRTQIKGGVWPKDIYDRLVATGWQEADVKAAFDEIEKEKPLVVTARRASPGVRDASAVKDAIELQRPTNKGTLFFSRLFVSGIVVVVTICLIPTVLGFVWRDTKTYDAQDLAVDISAVETSQNAYLELKAAALGLSTDATILFLGSLLHASIAQVSTVNSLLVANKPALDTLETVAKKTRVQGQRGAPTPLEEVASLRALMALNALYVESLLRSNNPKEAVKRVLVALDIAQIVRDSPSNVVMWSFAQEATAQHLALLHSIVANNQVFNSSEFSALERTLARYESKQETLVSAYKIYYTETANVAASRSRLEWEAAAHGLSPNAHYLLWFNFSNYYTHPQETIAYVAEASRAGVARALQNCAALSGSVHVLQKRVPLNMALWPITENLLGRAWFDQSIVQVDPAQARCATNRQLALLRLLIGIKSYEKEQGQPPTSLEVLVPSYLRDMPLDPLTEKPFRYNADRRLVY